MSVPNSGFNSNSLFYFFYFVIDLTFLEIGVCELNLCKISVFLMPFLAITVVTYIVQSKNISFSVTLILTENPVQKMDQPILG